ncbi:prepilin-type N-terminal cleavage/methylation domain-containing protein [Sulfurimonas sp.]|nr:prepilin-type N-terminal cleavage/methylation domain-containing protein [Sulfurimonas sp.]
MKRAGFTMIELIFVIVILGILSAVALPKFIGVAEQAEAGKCKAFIGTLNRTVGPSLWSDSVLNGSGATRGTITGAANPTAAQIQTAILGQVDEIPAECLNPVSSSASGDEFGEYQTFTFGDGTYDSNFTDGNSTNSPRWTWAKTN